MLVDGLFRGLCPPFSRVFGVPLSVMLAAHSHTPCLATDRLRLKSSRHSHTPSPPSHPSSSCSCLYMTMTLTLTQTNTYYNYDTMTMTMTTRLVVTDQRRLLTAIMHVVCTSATSVTSSVPRVEMGPGP